ncbi:MAG: FAD-dependent oxidoreductase [Patescibacteria group bacterium]|nr:FAD-dependent oxidoreductase [Patescibacteria group bacterium]
MLSNLNGKAGVARSDSQRFDVLIVGGGASGTALLYMLAKYTSIPSIALLEKYPAAGSVNSNARNNSQTLHIGEIETNYSMEKAQQVYSGAMMVKQYADSLPRERTDRILRQVQKMVLGVGHAEVAVLEERFAPLRHIFPFLQKLDADGIARAEPEVMRGRSEGEPVLALFNPEGYAVDYGALAASFVADAAPRAGIETHFNTEVHAVEPQDDGYLVRTSKGAMHARVVVFDTDSYSLGFAKKLGYGKEYSLIPIAGSFYFTRQLLKGKVYRVQDPRMPFAAVHGDPELTQEGKTRWGPTARFYPVLEARKFSTMPAFFTSSGFERIQTWISFLSILLDPVRFWYLLRNLFYDIPYLGPRFLLPQLRRIVPTLRASEIVRAHGYGGMRLQRVDTRSRQLLLGEGKIIGRNIIFNMSPSPGASVCLYNASRDADQIITFLPEYAFEKERMLADLCVTGIYAGSDPSLEHSYAS